MATATNHKAMELEGSLGAFPLADVMRILAMGRMTGILRLESSEHAVELSIKDGRLIGTASPERFLKLGQLLVYNGLINRRDLDEVLLEQREHDTGLPLGELLIDRGLVTREQVEHALRLQVKEEMWELFSWTDGSFRFEHGATPAMAHGLLSLDINRLLEEGEQHMSHWREIAQNLQNPHQVFAVRPDLAGFPEERLRPNVWKLLSLINGRHSLQTLVYMAGLGRFETLCGLDTLLRLNLIMPVEHPVGSMGSQRSDTGDVETQPDVEEAPVTGAQGRPGALLGLFGRRGGRGEGAEGG
ncbi:MAG TPA: DUF4388 domain-containing protein, partial [Candidatus Sumerlaeota bacterium]|nr:DUF4388 domain-containing protein [Candidatus Sumerlaeota bacterium]